jgi:hypothetical protein
MDLGSTVSPCTHRFPVLQFILSRVSIAHSCRARQCSLLCLAKSIPFCCARQHKHWGARTRSVSSQIGAVLCPAAKGIQLRRSCGVGQQPHAAAAHEQLRAEAAPRIRYPALEYSLVAPTYTRILIFRDLVVDFCNKLSTWRPFILP